MGLVLAMVRIWFECVSQGFMSWELGPECQG
jgi:hypothetical protein